MDEYEINQSWKKLEQHQFENINGNKENIARNVESLLGTRY